MINAAMFKKLFVIFNLIGKCYTTGYNCILYYFKHTQTPFVLLIVNYCKKNVEVQQLLIGEIWGNIKSVQCVHFTYLLSGNKD